MSETIGQIACDAWRDSHMAHHPGCMLTAWEHLSEQDRDDWEAAARAVLHWMSAL